MRRNMDFPSSAIKLLAIDIDGTLLDPHKHITPRTLQAIQAAQQDGLIVTLATARRYYNTVQIANTLAMDIPLILCDGALIVQHPAGSILHTHFLPAEIAQQAVEILVRHQLQPVAHHLNGTSEETWTGLSEFDNPWVTAYFSSYPGTLRRLHHTRFSSGQPDPLRLVVFAPEEAIADLIPEISQLDCSWNVTTRGNYGTAEMAIMHRDCSKASGIRALAQLLKIPLAEIMAIGDNNNDREMLACVGWGVAMGQAPDAVKAAAHATTRSNAEDGVALAIERYLLGCRSSASSNSFNRDTWR